MLKLPNVTGLRFFLAFFTGLFFLPAFVFAQERAQRIVNEVPKHIPLKIEIINGDFDSNLEDASVKITNIGEKPIYYLHFQLNTPNDFPRIDGHKSGLPSSLTFGDTRLSDLSKLANGDEKSLKPGDSMIFEINDKEALLFPEFLSKKGITEPPRLALVFQIISFGDGTGFLTTGGTKYPAQKKSSTSFYRSNLPDFFLRSRAE